VNFTQFHQVKLMISEFVVVITVTDSQTLNGWESIDGTQVTNEYLNGLFSVSGLIMVSRISDVG